MNAQVRDMNMIGQPDDALEEKAFLESYKKKSYPKPAATADIAVFRRVGTDCEVLMIRRGNHPFKGCWALPGGFVEPDEDVADAAARELEEETGITGFPLELFGIYGAPGRDPRGWTVSGGFCTLIDDAGDERMASMNADDDAADARWCPVRVRFESSDEGERAAELEVLCGPNEAPTVRFDIISQRFGAPRSHVTRSEGFAFDHARLLADAYLMTCPAS